MSITVLVIIVIVALILLFVGIKIVKSCLPQIIKRSNVGNAVRKMMKDISPIKTEKKGEFHK